MQITPCVISRNNILGGIPLENGGNPPNTNFKQVLEHLPGFENFTFFDFQKKFVSLHPTTKKLLPRESDQCAIRARLGVANHLSTTPRLGNPAKCLSNGTISKVAELFFAQSL